MDQDTLQLLLSHDDDGSPFLEDGLPDSAENELDKPTINMQDISSFWEESGDPDDLEQQRWGVIAPDGPEGDRLLALIRPLIEARAEAQDADVKIYRPPAGLSGSDAALWRKTHFDMGGAFSCELPRYQVILGDLDGVSLGLQQSQGSDGFVGRLSFRNDQGYEAYVEKVLRWEKARAEAEGNVKLFTVHDGTAATMIGYRALVKPGLDLLRGKGYDTADLGDPNDPSPDEFFEAVRSPEPTVLFSVSHGAGAPRGGWKTYQDQRERQGAMSFGRAGKITGSDINEEPFLPGGVWFMLACYGAGTPNSSAYRHWLEKLSEVGQFSGAARSVLASLPAGDHPPFIAALPQAVLANPNGPLAVIGHIDLAWTYSFEERDTGKAVSRPSKFMQTLRTALEGARVGSSYRELVKYLNGIHYELSQLHDEAAQRGEADVRDKARSGHLWMLRQDLSGYILLGDPATKLPASRRRKAKTDKSKTAGVASILSKEPEVKPAAPAPRGAEERSIPIETLEKAIGHMLAGSALRDIAGRFGIDPAVLQERFDIYTKAGRAALDRK